MTAERRHLGALPPLLLAAALALAPGATVARADAPPPADPRPTDLGELSLDQLMNIEVESVYGASRFAQRSLDAPTRVTVLTADDLRDHDYRSLAEALRAVAGLFVSYDRNYEYLGMRALGHVDDYNARVLVLVDGHRTNDNIFEGALIGNDFPIDLEQVDRIEVIRGPSSALYGSNAVQGAINVVTKHARQTAGVHASASGGSLGSRGGRLAWSGSLAGRGWLQLAASDQASDGTERIYFPSFDTPETNHGVAEKLDGERAHRLYGDATLGGFRLQGVYGQRRKTVPTASFGSVFDAAGFWTLDRRWWLDLAWKYAFTNRFEVAGRAYFDDYEYEGSYPSDDSGSGSGPVVLNRDGHVGRWAGVEANVHRSLFGPDEFVAGAEWRRNLRQHQRNWDEAPYRLRYDDDHQTAIWAVYAEDAFDLAPRLRLNAGLRHDEYTMFGGSTHPRVGLIWTPRERTALKLVYGSAFRVPTAYEVYLWGGGPDANTQIRPEVFRTGELVLESYFGEHYHASASGFVFRGERFIREDVIDGADRFYNEDVRGAGAEVELAARWRGAELHLGGVHQRVRLRPGDVRLSNSPADIVQVSGKVPLLPNRAWLSADAHTIGTRLNPFGEDVSGATITNANVIVRWPGQLWQVTAGARNLFDVRYGDVAGPEMNMTSVPQEGRTFRARLDVRFW